MLETLIGSLLGGVFRLAPEVIKWSDRKHERAHELAMFDKQLELDKLRSQAEIDKVNAESAAAIGASEMQIMVEAIKGQATLTGNTFVDGLNSLVRPLITYWWVIVLYTGFLVAKFALAVQMGDGYIQAAMTVWGQDEKAIVASIISFWFVDRSLRHYGPR